MKRFYKLVSTAREGSEFTVKLDDKPIHTPARNLLKIPNEAIADLIAQEWHVQSDPIIPDTMPLTQIIISAYDRITPQRDVLHNEIMPYLHTDLLCYRTDYPEDLGKQQAKTWDPHLKNIKKLFGHDV